MVKVFVQVLNMTCSAHVSPPSTVADLDFGSIEVLYCAWCNTKCSVKAANNYIHDTSTQEIRRLPPEAAKTWNGYE